MQQYPLSEFHVSLALLPLKTGGTHSGSNTRQFHLAPRKSLTPNSTPDPRNPEPLTLNHKPQLLTPNPDTLTPSPQTPKPA